METPVRDNKEQHRFEMMVEGRMALADYRLKDDVVQITHVETPVELRGGGVAGRLMEGIVQLVRGEGKKIHPICPYAVVWLKRHPEAQDLLA